MLFKYFFLSKPYPQEQLQMLAPFSAANSKALAIEAELATSVLPSWPYISQLISRTPELASPLPPAIPHTPLLLLFLAAIVPATWVPCPPGISSLGSPCLDSAYQKLRPEISTPLSLSRPFQADSLRSSCVKSIPESITATTTLGSPVSFCHAENRFIPAPGLYQPYSSIVVV